MNLAQKSLDNPSQLETLRFLIKYLWPEKNQGLRWRILLTVACLFGSKFVNVGVPLLYKKAVDSLSLNSENIDFYLLPLSLIFAYGGARIMAQLLGELRDILFARVEQSAIRKLALNTFNHLHKLSLRFHLDRKTGGLSRIIERGTASIETLLRFMLFNIFPTFLEILLVGIILGFLYDKIFVFITLSTLVVYVLYTFFMTEWRTNFVRKMNTSSNDANTKAIDSLLNYETVKYFGNETHESQLYETFLKSYESSAVKVKISLATLNLGQGIIISIGLVAVMSMAALGVVNKTLTLGDFVLLNTYLIQLYLPLNILGFAYREIKMSLINIEQMFNLLQEKKEIQEISEAPSLCLKEGEVIFKNVSFFYNDNRQILNHLNFKIAPGHRVAVVGPSGAGKSTLSRLLFRFYDIQTGQIMIDGQDISKVSQQSLRAAIGIVPQDTVLFNETIGYNIAYGHIGSTQEEVIQAAKHAQLHDFIVALPEGYDTMVGERGLKLSGGEKQRVAIARMILKAPKIFIFDEATSALDTYTEKAIQKNLQEISENHTTLIIAHRLSTIIESDEILVLEQGQIKERGSHYSLLQQNGIYAKMWQNQLEESQKPSVLDS
ncbi:MAG: ABCB family ABC transporter ATP-binding protein/permease [Janthinobacterium lividum]